MHCNVIGINQWNKVKVHVVVVDGAKGKQGPGRGSPRVALALCRSAQQGEQQSAQQSAKEGAQWQERGEADIGLALQSTFAQHTHALPRLPLLHIEH